MDTRVLRRAVSRRLPDFPWDRLTEAKSRAAAHPDGIVDLSIGTPVDSTPDVVQRALAESADSPGYPTTVGTPELRESVVRWLGRRFGLDGVDVEGVLPAIGSKELIAGLPVQLGVGPGDTVVIPTLAYPTYEVGAALAGADVVVSDSTAALGPQAPAIVWLNSPSNPTGRILPAKHLRKVVEWARERGTLVVSDECYLECAWEGEPPVSVLDEEVSGGSFDGILAVHSLSKRSNLAGYRGGFAVGDPRVIAELLAVRKNLGLMMPGPQQGALVAALEDDSHVDAQRARYADRRKRLRAAFESAGFRIDHSEGALYLWATRAEPCLETVAALAERGILVAPGDFYGASGARHVRIAFTATDERVAAACERL
ncbi:succinyldiaminopimelate transaminase [Solicola gregarius]|uniref:Succinyldiaminopimelate transaminase n=1 Tax=Solicola gregarius TaxID=2908642 RepID=A0AA46TJC8_9ACTN|nr:succinyldiaminopimelate transaminase [Solicola gregarius]UYM06198.1 succinyldiaminopimelate transaminase [Solicola gregarius]